MKQQNSILTSTLHCIFAGFCSGFFFNLIMIMIVMLVSDSPRANTFDDNTLTKQSDHAMPGQVKQGSLLFKNHQGLIQNYTLAPTLDTDVHIQITGMTARVMVKQKIS